MCLESFSFGLMTGQDYIKPESTWQMCEALTEWNADETLRGGLLESRSVNHKFQSHRGLEQRFRGKKTATIIANYDGQCYRC
jgi:hypothetical protein